MLLFILIAWDVKVEDGEIIEDASEGGKEANHRDGDLQGNGDNVTAYEGDNKPANWSRRDSNQRPSRMVTYFSHR